MIMSEQVALEMDDGTVTLLTFCTRGRSPTLPPGATWNSDGSWSRPATDDNIWHDLRKTFRGRNGAGIRRPVPLAIHRNAGKPSLRDFRNAWALKNGAVVEDVEKAKNVHRDRMRVERTEMLLELDRQWIIATRDKDNAAVAEINAEKQVLLDATDDPRIVAAQNCDDLRAVSLGGILQEAVSRGSLKSSRALASRRVP